MVNCQASTGAGYVIRRILRRAVRYYFSYLDRKEPLLHLLVPVLAKQFETVFPELQQQVGFVSKVVLEEENGFLKTLDNGLKKLESLPIQHYNAEAEIIDGDQYSADSVKANYIHNKKAEFIH
jgi:alanyl-tRNA synthetase